MSSDVKSLPVHEMDTTLLFEKYTVEEIRKIESQTRAEIERKKEDLRTMVGERYRDLIEAADTITEMKNSAQNVKGSIVRMEEMFSQLKQSHMVKGSSLHHRKKLEMENKRKEEARFYGVASQIKLLLDMPEKVWSCLDCENYLTASRLFLLSRHINTSLQLDSQNSPNFLYWFPVLNRQWAAISHFKVTILQGCRRLLKEPDISDQKIAESLCSIMLLDDSNPRQVFNEFLLARTSAVQQLFVIANQSGSTKDQVCTLVQLITTTIHQIHAVFYSSQEEQDSTSSSTDQVTTNLLLKILTEVTSQKQHESGLIDLHTSVSAKCLPTSVTDFCISHKSFAMGISTQHLQDSCQTWIQTCISDVKTGVTKLLSYVNSVKYLATIRDTVWELQSQDTNLNDWDLVCKRVLNHGLPIWQELLRPLFLSRVQALIKYQLDLSSDLAQRQVNKIVMEMSNFQDSGLKAEIDLASYIWTESHGDITQTAAWTSSGSRSLLESGGLMMKARAFTPVVQSLCKKFDEKLCQMLEDAYHYVTEKEEDRADGQKQTGPSPFNKYGDSQPLLNFIQTSCKDSIQLILKFLQEQLSDWEKQLSESTDRNSVVCNRILLVGRLCAALCELTPNLQKCMMGYVGLERQDCSRNIKKLSGKLGSKQSVTSPAWDDVKSKLVACQHSAYRIWADHLSGVLLQGFHSSVLIQTPEDLVQTCARWDEVVIDEETEDGKTVSSKISVPMQPSGYLLCLLYDLCHSLNQVGSHAISRQVLNHLVYSISDGLMTVYEKVLQSDTTQGEDRIKMNQKRALQLLFDVRFHLLVMPRKEDNSENKSYQSHSQKVIARLEEKVDPFDLDVFSPFIQSNLSKQAQRCSVLLGPLTSLDRSGLMGVTSRGSGSTQQEQHNVLLLSTCQNRFSLLPLSTQTNRYNIEPTPVLSRSMFKGSESGRMSLAETAAAVIPQPSQEKMTASSSFYDKLGTGLGSMSELSSWFSTIGSKN